MPIPQPTIPNFTVQQPPAFDPIQKLAQFAQLKSMLNQQANQQALFPLEQQEQQERVQQMQMANKLAQLQFNSQQNFMNEVSSGNLNKFVGANDSGSQDGSGFDAAGAYQHLVSKGVLPEQASQWVNGFQTIAKNVSEIRKNNNEAQVNFLKARADSHEQLAQDLSDIMKLPPQQQAAALQLKQAEYAKNPPLGIDSNDLAILGQADPSHLKAIAGVLDLNGRIEEYHAKQAEAANLAGKSDPNSPLYEPSPAAVAMGTAPGAKQIQQGQAAQASRVAGADAAARFPYELSLKQQELAQNPVFAVNPKTGQRELSTFGDAKAQGLTNPVKVTQADIEKETTLNAQLNDLQLNTSRYKTALNAMGNLSKSDVAAMTHILSDPNVNAGLLNNVGLPSVLSMVEQGSKASDWNSLSPDKQAALIGALRMKNSALLFQKVSTGMGRASKEAMDIEIANMPSPVEGATVGNQKLQAFQENVDQMSSRSVKLPWMDQPQDVRARIEQQATEDYNRKQGATGQYPASIKPSKAYGRDRFQPGDMAMINGRLKKVAKVYPNGSFDTE